MFQVSDIGALYAATVLIILFLFVLIFWAIPEMRRIHWQNAELDAVGKAFDELLEEKRKERKEKK